MFREGHLNGTIAFWCQRNWSGWLEHLNSSRLIFLWLVLPPCTVFCWPQAGYFVRNSWHLDFLCLLPLSPHYKLCPFPCPSETKSHFCLWTLGPALDANDRLSGCPHLSPFWAPNLAFPVPTASKAGSRCSILSVGGPVNGPYGWEESRRLLIFLFVVFIPEMKVPWLLPWRRYCFSQRWWSLFPLAYISRPSLMYLKVIWDTPLCC